LAPHDDHGIGRTPDVQVDTSSVFTCCYIISKPEQQRRKVYLLPGYADLGLIARDETHYDNDVSIPRRQHEALGHYYGARTATSLWRGGVAIRGVRVVGAPTKDSQDYLRPAGCY
jgi:hypothetical protein